MTQETIFFRYYITHTQRLISPVLRKGSTDKREMEEREPPTSRQSNPEQPGPWMAESPRPSHSSPPPQTLTPVQSIQNNEDDQDFYKIPEQETQQRKGCLKKLKRELKCKDVWIISNRMESFNLKENRNLKMKHFFFKAFVFFVCLQKLLTKFTH